MQMALLQRVINHSKDDVPRIGKMVRRRQDLCSCLDRGP